MMMVVVVVVVVMMMVVVVVVMVSTTGDGARGSRDDERWSPGPDHADNARQIPITPAPPLNFKSAGEQPQPRGAAASGGGGVARRQRAAHHEGK
jgi:hypothetical protein